ncbi:MAG: 3-deoxy-8-phosphooctulonate synthase, partial [Campylobacteraceae bacterium]|nr:3-deoxy-8-phosphooctulonate synthase [Campylobacteraceae bacterium]
FFFETHFNPCEALCDGPNMLDLEELDVVIQSIKKIQNALK